MGVSRKSLVFQNLHSTTVALMLPVPGWYMLLDNLCLIGSSFQRYFLTLNISPRNEGVMVLHNPSKHSRNIFLPSTHVESMTKDSKTPSD